MPRPELKPTAAEEAARQLVICNACRYCEGYCAVFPAMELRTSFSPGDVLYPEVGNGGLWFRVDDELAASLERLLDPEVGTSLGEQGRSYAAGRFGDTDTYVKRVAEVLLG